MKAFKTMGFKRGKGKHGFTLIELLIVMVILAILAGVVVMAVGGIFGQAKSRAYDTIKPQIQNGVTAYTTTYQGDLPEAVSNSTYTVITEAGQNVSGCYVFDLCSITGVGEILRQVPDGCMQGGGDDNFDAVNASCAPTGAGQHYVWVIDSGGNVYSMCDESEDGTIQENGVENVDGFHGISTNRSKDYWP
jgi:prepilin-type N-terminal cleavage/methylation domain-containing protein